MCTDLRLDYSQTACPASNLQSTRKEIHFRGLEWLGIPANTYDVSLLSTGTPIKTSLSSSLCLNPPYVHPLPCWALPGLDSSDQSPCHHLKHTVDTL